MSAADKSSVFAILLALLISPPVFSAEEKEAADFLMKGHWKAEMLVQWELYRLDELGNSTAIDFPEGSSLAKKIKDGMKGKEKDSEKITLESLKDFLSKKPQLSKEEQDELLGVLRLANTKNRVDFDTNESAYQTLIEDELKKIDSDQGKNVALKLPKDLEDKIIREAKEANLELDLKPGQITSADLKRFLSNPKIKLKKGLFKEKELAPLLGQIRKESAKERGSDFISDVVEDKELDKIFAEIGRPIPIKRVPRDVFGKTASEGGIKTFFPKEKEKGEPQKPIVKVPEALKRAESEKGLHGPSNKFSFADKGRERLDEGSKPFPKITGGGGGTTSVPSAFDLDIGFGNGGGSGGNSGDDGLFLDRDRLRDGVGKVGDPTKEKQKSGKFSLVMRMNFQGAGSARCQITVVDKKPEGDSCKFTAATARHCVVNEENPSAQLTSVSIQGVGRVVNPKFDADPNGHDFALLSFGGACESVSDDRVIPLRKDRVRHGEDILVETVPGGTMVGRAKDAVSGSSLMALDVRSSLNEPFGINPGDSGGGVATVNENGKLELVGVISSKPVDPNLAGIGFFAAKDSMEWAQQVIDLRTKAIARLQSPAATSSDLGTH